MKVLLQRVSRAAVRVDGLVVGAISHGLLVLLGVERGDDERDALYFADKTAALRIFPDALGRMNRSVAEAEGAVLVVSQFTLVSSTRRGRRPSFEGAAAPEMAEPLCRRFGERLAEQGLRVEWGRFRARMEVEVVNDGPVTILLDPRRAEGAP